MTVKLEIPHAAGLAFFRMQRELSALFGRKVDMDTEADLRPYSREQVLNEAEVLYDAT